MPPVWFDYLLAEKLGRPVGEIREGMTARDLIMWAAYRARVAEIEDGARQRAKAGRG